MGAGMMGQTLLFPDPRPLVERLGHDFFRQLTERPGVYQMRDAQENILYVGKAKNLKKRLNSYRVVNPDRLGRRHLRLLHAVVRITYLLFLKMAEERGAVVPKNRDWASLKAESGTALTDHYADILRKLREQPGILGDIFAQATPRFNNPVNLKRVIAMIDEEDWSAMDVDVKGAAFEGLLEKAASEGKKGAGQYFTPRPLIQTICKVMKPDPRGNPDFRLCDPACGTGGFLVCAWEVEGERAAIPGGGVLDGELVGAEFVSFEPRAAGGFVPLAVASAQPVELPARGAMPFTSPDFIGARLPVGELSSRPLASWRGWLAAQRLARANGRARARALAVFNESKRALIQRAMAGDGAAGKAAARAIRRARRELVLPVEAGE